MFELDFHRENRYSKNEFPGIVERLLKLYE
jgi:hypothetical protein